MPSRSRPSASCATLATRCRQRTSADVETKVTALREALKGNDMDAVRSRSSELAESLQRVGTAAYQASSTGGPSDGAGPEEGNGASQEEGAAEGSPDAEEAVEGEFKEV